MESACNSRRNCACLLAGNPANSSRSAQARLGLETRPLQRDVAARGRTIPCGIRNAMTVRQLAPHAFELLQHRLELVLSPPELALEANNVAGARHSQVG